MKHMKQYAFGLIIGLGLLMPSVLTAASILNVYQGGTGRGTSSTPSILVATSSPGQLTYPSDFVYVNGSVGIGTTTPGHTLSVAGTAKATKGRFGLATENGTGGIVWNNQFESPLLVSQSFVGDLSTNGSGLTYEPLGAYGHYAHTGTDPAIIFGNDIETLLTSQSTGPISAFYGLLAQASNESNNPPTVLVGIQGSAVHAAGTADQVYGFRGFGTSGATTTWQFGVAGNNEIYGNPVTHLGAFRAQAPFVDVGSTVENQYGLYVDPLTAATNNYAVYASGTTQSFFGGSIGIGTTSPAGRLTVGHTGAQGATALVIGRTDNTPANGAIRWANNAGTYSVGIGTNFNSTGDNLEFLTNLNQTRMTVTSAGNVGIGTTGPTSKLEVYGSASAGNNTDYITISSLNHGGAIGDGSSLAFTNGVSTVVGRVQSVVSAGSYDLAFHTGGTIGEKMRIKANGNVGIGTTTPGSRLTVSGYADLIPLFIQSGATNSTNIAISNTSTPRQWNVGVTGSANSIGGGKFFLYDNNAPAFRFLIDTAGNALIGTTSPTFGTPRLTLYSTGDNAAIELNAPSINTQAAFNIIAPAPTSLNDGKAFAFIATGESFARGTFYVNGAYGIGPGSGARDTFISRSAANTLKVDSNLTEGFANLYVTGRVGIGSSTPSALLSIQASTTQATLNLIRIASTSNATMLALTPANRFGLGTGAPTSLMHITSNATTTVTWDSTSVTQGACIKIKDADGTGYTYLTVNNGTATYSTASCE